MEKIKEFQISNLTVTNFKCFAKPKTFNFGHTNFINGENGQGKSSIADAISFAFCGTPFWGNKSSDRLIANDMDNMQVEVDLIDENNNCHKLIRRKTKAQSAVIFDSIQVRQSDIVNIFADKDIFLSIFNPLYFIEKIGENGSELLQKLLPPIKHEDILHLLSEHSQNLLENENISDPGFYIKKKREYLRELEDNSVYLTGQIDLLKNMLVQNAKAVEEAEIKSAKLRKELDALVEKQYKNIDIKELAEERKKILDGIDDAKLKELQQKLSGTEAASYISTFMGDISKTEAELSQLYAGHKKVSTVVNTVKIGNKCPTCFRTITAQNFESFKAELKKGTCRNRKKWQEY